MSGPEIQRASTMYRDLYPAERAPEMEMRSLLVTGLTDWLGKSGMTQAEAAEVLGVNQARVSDLKRGKSSGFSLGFLVRLATKAGLRPKMRLVP